MSLLIPILIDSDVSDQDEEEDEGTWADRER